MELDPFVLSRIQFAANISFHILFPSVSIGLCWLLVYFRLRYTFSDRDDRMDWEYAYFFWVKVFALTFALGVVSGITMSFQFGTNWPGFMERAGNIAGPLLGYEVLTAFFLEASFLGIMLYGKNLVSNRTHLISAFLVAIGTTLSAFWIISLNSWMHTPAGFTIENGVFMVDDWWAIVFNPSFKYRFIHVVLASLLTAWYSLQFWRPFKFLSATCMAWWRLRTSLPKSQPSKVFGKQRKARRSRCSVFLTKKRAQPTWRSRYPSLRVLFLLTMPTASCRASMNSKTRTHR